MGYCADGCLPPRLRCHPEAYRSQADHVRCAQGICASQGTQGRSELRYGEVPRRRRGADVAAMTQTEAKDAVNGACVDGLKKVFGRLTLNLIDQQSQGQATREF